MKLTVPFIVAAVYAYFPLMFEYQHATKLLSLLGAYVVPPLGKESIIPTGISFGIDPLLLVSSIIVIDMCAALFVFWNYNLLKKIHFIEKILDKIEAKSQKILNKKWFGKVWWVGLFLFMIIPLQGSGSISTTIAGRVLGAGKKVLIIVLLGSAVSSSSIGFASDTILNAIFQL